MNTTSSLRQDEEPIAALSTAAGSSAVAIIRLSGTGSHQLLQNILRFKTSQQTLAKIIWRQFYLCECLDKHQEVVDEPLVVFFKGPHSFTGQDSAEIHCHGSPFIITRILESLYQQGFREAQPGEFTRRAFLAGKMDLTQAEGIRELVNAHSEQQWLAARQLATGHLAVAIEQLRNMMIESQAYLEAQIDFPDEGDTAALHLGAVDERVRKVGEQIHSLLSTYQSGKVASQGLTVSFFGAPNAGKSTLLNELLGKERAIVTPVAGTTRDFIEESCLISGRLFRFIDMAGIRQKTDTKDPIEWMGIERARKLAQESDLVLVLMPADASEQDFLKIQSELTELGITQFQLLLSKADLGVPSWASKADFLAISCLHKTGMDELRQRLVGFVDGFVGNIREATFITSLRHAQALEQAQSSLTKFWQARQDQAYEEMLAFELMQATKQLTSIIGDVDNEDILDKIFSTFCLGK